MSFPSGKTSRFTLPDRTTAKDNQGSKPAQAAPASSTDAAVWTQANYVQAAPIVRFEIADSFNHIQTKQPPEPDASPGNIQSHSKVVAIWQEALSTPNATFALNPWVLGWGIWQSGIDMDDGSIIVDGPRDREVNVEVTRLAKVRIMAVIEEELLRLGNKDAENVIRYLSSVLVWMDDGFEVVRRKAGFTGENKLY